MNKTVTRPGHMVPGWQPSPVAEEASEYEREERAGVRLVGLATLSLILALAALVVWGVLTLRQATIDASPRELPAVASHVI